MAKKGWLKTIVGVGAVAVAGKVAYDKLKNVQEEYQKEEAESLDAEVKKYNALAAKKLVEIEDETFTGCELKAVASNVVLDLSLAAFEKDVYINFTSRCSDITIILPEGVNVAVDVEKTLSGVHNCVENSQEEGIYTVYIIGKASLSNMQILPINFYVDDDDDFEDMTEQAEEPEVEAKEPEVEAKEPEVEAKEPEAEQAEPEVEKKKPKTEQAEPEVEVKEPKTEQAEPEIEVKEPKTEQAELQTGEKKTTFDAASLKLKEEQTAEANRAKEQEIKAEQQFTEESEENSKEDAQEDSVYGSSTLFGSNPQGRPIYGYPYYEEQNKEEEPAKEAVVTEVNLEEV